MKNIKILDFEKGQYNFMPTALPRVKKSLKPKKKNKYESFR